MREIINFCDHGKSIRCNNRVECYKLNKFIANREVEIIFDNFSLNSHPKGVRLSIIVGDATILRLHFNYLREFHGYIDKWEKSIVRIFYQEEFIDTEGLTYREIPMSFFVLHNESNNFLIKSRNLNIITEYGTYMVAHP